MSPLLKAGAVLALLVALVACVFLGVKGIDQRGYQRAQSEATAALAQQKQQAGELLATEAAKTRSAEEALRTNKLNQDKKDAQAQSTVADLSRRLRQLSADNAGRLRDPNAQGCGGSGSGPEAEAASATGSGGEHPAHAGGLLSAELSGLLRQLAGEADAINLAYASCRADALQVRALQP